MAKPSCATCYVSWDHLGSVRMLTDGSGNVVARQDYLPFGEEIPDGYAGFLGGLAQELWRKGRWVWRTAFRAFIM